MDEVDFEWDDDNVEHLARHGISPDEVEDLFEGPILRRRGGTDAPDRVRVLGRTAAGRYLAIIYQEKGRGLIRPFTGWEMRPHERDLYVRQTRN
ncbi:MAG: BrnT family toxin [Chloroflexota bacterium]